MAASRNRPALESPGGEPLLAAFHAQLLPWLDAQSQRHGRPLQLAVGYSGGRDSTALLDALSRQLSASNSPHVLTAVHVHHGLSPLADDWAAHAEVFCKKRSVPLTVQRVSVQQDGHGLEAAAREARYAVFASLPVDAVILAHHQSDQAETVLMNALRGAGPHGLAGMPFARRLGSSGRWLLRPWLGAARPEIDAYLAQHQLAYVDDPSNADVSLTRNRLRQQELPDLERLVPGARVRLAELAERMAEAALLLDERADEDAAAVSAGGADSAVGGLSLSALAILSPARQRNVLYRWLATQGLRFGSWRRLEEWRRQCVEARPDRQVELQLKGASGSVMLRVWRGVLRAVPCDLVSNAAEISGPLEPVPLTPGAEVSWAGGRVKIRPALGDDAPSSRLDGVHLVGLEIRSRAGGERLRLRPGGPSRPLRLLFQEAAVPPWQRAIQPYLWRGNELLAVPGIGAAAAFQAKSMQEAWVVEWRPPDAA